MGGFQAVVGLTMWRRQANSAMTRANLWLRPARDQGHAGQARGRGRPLDEKFFAFAEHCLEFFVASFPHAAPNQRDARDEPHLPGAKCRFRSFGKCQHAVVLEQDLTAPSSICGKPAPALSSFSQAPACRRSSFVPGAAFANGIPAPSAETFLLPLCFRVTNLARYKSQNAKRRTNTISGGETDSTWTQAATSIGASTCGGRHDRRRPDQA
jgi:hypothetical protein